MLSVILVDNEEEILQGLSRSINWNSIGYQILHMTTDPVEAVEKVAELKPNAVVTDIKMPRLSGLELISRIQQSSPLTKTIVISGYSDFELVKKALQLGVFNYLLKPVDEDELLQSLAKIRSFFVHKEHPKTDEPVSQPMLLRLLSNATSLPTSLSGKTGFMFACAGHSEQKVFLEENAEALHKWLSQYGLCSFAEKNGITYFLVLGEAPNFSELNKEYQKLTAEWEEHFFSACSVSIHKLEFLTEWSHVLANQLISDRFFRREKQLKQLSAPTAPQSRFATDWVLGSKPEVFRAFRHMISDMRFHEIPELFAELECILSSSELNANPYETRIAYRDVLSYVKISMSDLGCSSFSEHYINEALVAIESADTIQQISVLAIRAFQNAIQNIPPLVSNGKVNASHIQAYLHLHLAEDLSLSRVASLFFLSTSYLSTLFSKEIGQPFSAYVLSLRLKKAAELLIQTKMSIGDICNAVGFSSEKTFFKQFRVRYHCTPTQFRKYNGANESLST